MKFSVYDIEPREYGHFPLRVVEDDHRVMSGWVVEQEPLKQKVGHYEIGPQKACSFGEKERIVNEKDGRVRISNVLEYPYIFTAKLDLEVGGTLYGGTGVIIGPHHLITAAHNVYDQPTQTSASRIRVSFGVNGSSRLMREVHGCRIYVPDLYKAGNDEYDFALVVLGASIGIEMGWCGFVGADLPESEEAQCEIVGYPGDKNFNEMWGMKGSAKLTDKGVFHKIDTYPGQSGSGLVLQEEMGFHLLVGVHTQGRALENYGVLLTREKARALVGWIRETGYIRGDPLNHKLSSRWPTLNFFTYQILSETPDHHKPFDEKGFVEVVRGGGDVNVKLLLGATPLMCLCAKDRHEEVITILGAGARWDILDEEGQDLLSYLDPRGEFWRAIADSLLRRGLRPSPKHSYGGEINEFLRRRGFHL